QQECVAMGRGSPRDITCRWAQIGFACSLKGWCGCVPLPPAALKVGRGAKDKDKGAPDVRFGSKADIRRSLRQRPLYPRKRTSAVGPGMSRFVPEADLKRPLMRCPLWPRHHCGLSFP